jgi:diguanylate cyclase (GGDEF)-like protein
METAKSTELERVHAALRTLSAGNRALIRATDEHQLLRDMCRVIVEVGGYRIACVGYAEHDEHKTIRWMASAGIELETLEAFPLTWADDEAGQTAAGVAIRTGNPSVGRNLQTDPSDARWREEARAGGYASASTFPLSVNAEVLGHLSICASEPDAFDHEEVHVLAELADDLAYGIANLRTRALRREAEERIERAARHDGLTGLPNRVLLRERLEAAIDVARRRHRPLALLLVEVGRFQEINETLGYREGDQLLQLVAQRLGQVVTEEECLARVGEAEFGLVVHGGADDATQLAQRLFGALDAPVELDGLSVATHARIGIALFPGHGVAPDVLIRKAKVAAYQAKATVRGLALYADTLDEECTRRIALMGDLRQAIEHDELVLYCQPKVHIASGEVCGAEALVRWQHPRHGMLEPGGFIKLAEHAGLITPLTHWVLDAAFSQSYAWREAGLDRSLAVNLSAHDLHDPGLLDRIRGLFATWGTRPPRIQFELTESALMEDPAGALDMLVRLKQFGVELFVDDFGTGYSSLSYLHKLPVDSIKIDQSFVGSMLASDDSAILVRSMIELAHNLALGVVAEGVETQGVWQRLAALGCDDAQGYFISPPIPAEQMQHWEAGWQAR